MSEFVDECREEWRRLGVPDPVANEMAADLTADLREAESEGVSAEEVLGTGAFDPRSFAGDWARERGVVRATSVVDDNRPVPESNARRRPFLLAFVAALAIIAVIGLALVTRASHSVAVARFKPAFPDPIIRHEVIPPWPDGGHGDAWVHGIGALLLLAGIVGLIAAALYWARRIRPNH